MKDWINPQVFENKFDSRCNVLVYPQVNIFNVPDNAPKEFKRFAYAVRGLVEAVEVTKTGETVTDKSTWRDKIFELDNEDIPPNVESTPAQQGQPGGNIVQDNSGNIIGIAGNTNADGTVDIILYGTAEVNLADRVLAVNSAGRFNWRTLAVSGDIIHGSFNPQPDLNLYEIVVKFLRENGELLDYIISAQSLGIIKNKMPADLEVLMIEYSISSQTILFTVWSQFFIANALNAESVRHELVFADLKEQKPKVSEDGRQLRKLMIEETHEQNI